MEGYGALLIFTGVALVVGLVHAVVNDVIGARKRDPMEDYPYECGVPLYDPEARGTFKQGYYLLGLLLLLFDIEVAYLFPWAVVFEEIGLIGLLEAVLFIFVLALGFLYAWAKGALRWQV